MMRTVSSPHVQIWLDGSGGALQTDVSLDDVGVRLRQPNTVGWIDVERPGRREYAWLRESFELHPLAIEDAEHRRQRPKVDRYERSAFLVFYAAHLRPHGRVHLVEIDIFVGPNFLITLHAEPMPELSECIRRWQSAANQDGAPNHFHGSPLGLMLHALLDTAVDGYFPVVDHLTERLDEVEDQLFRGFNRGTIHTIFQMKKDLLSLRRVLGPQRDVLNVLARLELPVLSESDAAYFQDVFDHTLRLTESVDLARDLLTSALEAYLSLESNRLNQTMRSLTAIATMLMTGSLIAAIYGMNFEFMPELHWPLGYPAALLLMVATGGGLAWYFRRIGWL